MGIVLIVILCGLGNRVSALGEDHDDYQQPAKVYAAGADLLVARPVLAFGAVIPTFGFLATLPITYPFNQTVEYLMHRPWQYASDRPLGVFLPKKVTSRIDEKISSQYQAYFIRVGADRSPDAR